MPDIANGNLNGPDYGAIEKGKMQAVSDAIWLLNAQLQQEIQTRQQQIQQQADTTPEWVIFIGGL